MLSTRGKTISDLWEEDKEIVIYDTIKECLDKIRYYSENEEERKKIAKAGQKRSLENYSFTNTLDTIWGVIDEG